MHCTTIAAATALEASCVQPLFLPSHRARTTVPRRHTRRATPSLRCVAAEAPVVPNSQKPAKHKITRCDFTNFSKLSFNKFTWFPFPVIACFVSYSKFVKRTSITSWFHEFFEFCSWQVLCNLAQLFAARWSRGLQKKTNVHTRFSLKMSSAWH